MLLLPVLPASAGLRWQAESLSFPGLAASGVLARLDNTADGGLTLELKLARLDVAALGWRGVALDCHGEVTRQAAKQWQFKGDLALRGAAGGALSKATISLDLDNRQNTLALALDQRGQQVNVAWPLDELGHMQIQLKNLPLAWLQGVLEQAWDKGKLGQGKVNATLSVDVEDAGMRSAGRYDVGKVGFDSSDGSIAGQAINSRGHWMLISQDKWTSINLDSQLQGGDLLLGPLYASLPTSSARLRLEANFDANGAVLKQLHFDDGKYLRFDGLLGFDKTGKVDRVRLDGLRAVFPGAWTHYAQSMLATAGFGKLDMDGMVTASASWDRSGWQRFSFDAEGLDVTDPAQRIGVQALNGRLDWARDGVRKPSQLSWNSLTLLSLDLGRARTAWRSQQGTLGLTSPASVPMLGGQVFLNELAWSPEAPTGQQQVAASLAYSGIDLARLSAAFGWPAFKGTVGGAIPGLEYDGDRLKLDGGVAINVFDGFVDVTRLVLQHPFGPAPVLTAAVGFRDLDLAPMTRIFDFGSITGRLNGHVDGLRMIAWKPVAFSAELLADDGGRISQKAVNSISNLGGGGLAGGLQSTVLRVFDSFGYKRIGLGCVLRDDVCTMTGLGKAEGGGYNIVEGRGLPHISVIGHQHKVDWSTLVARLEAATSGGNIKVE